MASLLIAATLGCVLLTFVLLLLLFKFIVGILYPLLAVGLMKFAHRLLTKHRKNSPDPKHLVIQEAVILGGMLSVAIAYILTDVISLRDLAIAGGSMAFLAILDMAIVQYRVGKALRAADKAMIKAEEARKIAHQGEPSTADEMLQDALLTTELAHGSVHPQVATIVMYLADVMRSLKRMDAATVLYKRAGEIHIRLGQPTKGLVKSLRCYAEQLQRTGEFEQATLIVKRAISECKRLEQAGAATGRCWRALSEIQTSLGKIPEAYRSSLTAAQMLEAKLGDTHQETLTAEGMVATHCVTLGRLAEAERIVRDVLAKKQRLGNNQDSEYLNLLLDLHSVQVKGGRNDSVKTMQEAIEIYRASVGPDFKRDIELLQGLPDHLARGKSAKTKEFYTALLENKIASARGALTEEPILVNQVDASGWTPLQWAVFFDRRDIIESLLTMEADHAFGAGTDYPAMFIASRWKRKWAMQALHRKEADIEILAVDGSRPLHAAVRSGDQLTVDVLVSRSVLLDQPNHRGWTPLHEAAYAGEKKLLVELISKGVDVNFQAPTHQESPLHAAILGGNWATTETLVLNMADINAPNAQNVTPLRLAEQRGLRDIVELLMSYGENSQDKKKAKN